MDLFGSYQTKGYTVGAYFPQPDAPDLWTIWVIRDKHLLGEFRVRIQTSSVCGIDMAAIARLEAAAESATEIVADTRQAVAA